ncbi:MAG: ribosomal protein S18-alanine N-acetyltransferase [Actinomycetales bacterium]
MIGPRPSISGDDPIELSPPRWWHLETLASLDAELFDPDVWSLETFWAELAAPGRTYVIAHPQGRDEEILGYAGLAVSGSEADVQTIAVAPSAQGRGLGRTLLTALIEAATGQGARHLMLEVRADNVPAITLYNALGFTRIAVRRGYYQPGGIDAHIMRLTVR